MTLTVRHTSAEGTLLLGTSTGDGISGILSSIRPVARWRWSRTIGAWYVVRTRDRTVRRDQIDATRAALLAAGYDVTVDIGDEQRSVTDREVGRVTRTEGRIEALTARAEGRLAAGDAEWGAARELASQIPLGQPILVGHHSERRHRRDLERIKRAEQCAIAQLREGAEAARRAGAAEANQTHHVSGPATERRIERLAAELRRLERLRRLPPDERSYVEHIEGRKVEVKEQLEYWRTHLSWLTSSAAYRVWTRDDFQRGDWIAHNHGWSKVLRVNPKTLTVPHIELRLAELSMTWKVSYDQVTERRPPDNPP